MNPDPLDFFFSQFLYFLFSGNTLYFLSECLKLDSPIYSHCLSILIDRCNFLHMYTQYSMNTQDNEMTHGSEGAQWGKLRFYHIIQNSVQLKTYDSYFWMFSDCY